MTEGDIVFEVVSALADAEGVEASELDYRLAEYVDTDALTRLTEMDGGVWEFSFHVDGHEVTLTHDGRTYVDGVAYRGGIRIEEPSST